MMDRVCLIAHIAPHAPAEQWLTRGEALDAVFHMWKNGVLDSGRLIVAVHTIDGEMVVSSESIQEMDCETTLSEFSAMFSA